MRLFDAVREEATAYGKFIQILEIFLVMANKEDGPVWKQTLETKTKDLFL